MHRYLFRGQSQSIPAFGFFDANFQEFAKHTGGRRSCSGIGSTRWAKYEARPKVREHYASNKGQEMVRELREIFQKAGA